MFSAIVCTDQNYGIGMADGTIPFRNSADLQNFRRLTTGNIVIMGYKTWQTLKAPLSNRLNIVISRRHYSDILQSASLLAFRTIEDCLIYTAKKEYKRMEKFVIGGATIYDYFLQNKLVQKIYHTRVCTNFDCDIKMKKINTYKHYTIIDTDEVRSTEEKLYYSAAANKDNNLWIYRIYEFINNEEEKFLDVLYDINTTGTERFDRTSVGTKAMFGKFLEFDLSNNTIPIGTTKAVPLRMVFEELMWFLRGQTDATILEQKGVNVWKGNSSKEFLERRGLTYEVGDIGPTYGFSFRHYGAQYINAQTDYTGQGCDQLSEVVRLIKEDPYSRRIMINLWNPAVLDQVALPPCLYGYQFFVERDSNSRQTLSCLMSQRSSDISLAGFWNIATGSLLTIMLARVTGLQPKSLKWSIGDAHIYNNQFNAVKIQLERTPRCFPKLFFKESAPNLENNKGITEFEFDDLVLVGYNPYPAIKSIMNV